MVVWEGVTSEDKCVVAGGTWINEQCTAILFEEPDAAGVEVYWHPRLMDDAYDAVDPEAVESDYWESLDTGEPWGIYNHHVFYHFKEADGQETELEALQEALAHAVRSVFVPLTDYAYFPHRNDVAWENHPDTITVTGIYLLGEQRTLLLNADPEDRGVVGRGEPNIDLPLPTPPPIRPTTPFAEPRWPDTAKYLGRDCPPLEEIWDGSATEVTDPCTLQAIETAVNLMWTGSVEYRQRAIRDGHALADFLQEIDNIEDPYHKATLDAYSRANGWTFIREVEWVGNWPGASMIYLEWNSRYPEREFTPEDIEAKDRYYRGLVERGFPVPDEFWGDGITLFELFWSWHKALMVRAADGTWRMSYRSFCFWYASVNLADQLLCPDDPNPHFPDSVWFDFDIYPPSHKNYYQNRRATSTNLPHQDRGTPRITDQYWWSPTLVESG